MAKTCDNTSSGIIVRKAAGKILMIERKKYNFGYALPAGHQDGDSPEAAARKELEEEVGLTAERFIEKLALDLPNPCKRDGGTHHLWHIFETENWHGEVRASDDEVKTYIWADAPLIKIWAKNLAVFCSEMGISLAIDNLPQIVKATNESQSWAAKPGLEPPMYFLFQQLGII